MRTKFGEHIKKLREDRGWNRAELARRMSIRDSTIARIEDGRNLPQQRTVRDLERVFELPERGLEWLWWRDKAEAKTLSERIDRLPPHQQQQIEEMIKVLERHGRFRKPIAEAEAA